MRWLEIIKLRSVEKDSGLLKELLLSFDKNTQQGLVEMKTYDHAALATDLSVHLHWQSERPGRDGSAFGILIAQGLKEFGLIDHSIWVEKEK